ncbi:ribosome maturation factor RimM [Luteimonas wenzhouensis]|jgi:16S rRNA processing protein RimM|uniref:Ribosome maturation factor RimM n=1 Tax=Luteimonas wenzhouensis TaxID=2599615 RepID=A0A5C5U698_9GAMM|nr:ribosome maturation factor RimM [Luteimonas wenzhouensis]NLW95902.1 ribosome maturation factor RimM [Xanthomonadaceae bacterium]TWT21853.1 ribosome maturation factor RimM [Luteimonas wenzhouensis]
MNDPGRRILMGRIRGAFGVRGEVKLESFSDPPGAVLRYRPLLLRTAQGLERELEGIRGRATAKGIVAQIPGVEDRDAAQALFGAELYVPRSALPPPRPGEYYWVDLEGLRVVNADGVDLGVVSHLFSTGANDVMVVHGERERMVPFVQPDYILAVDLDAGQVTVDWDPEF